MKTNSFNILTALTAGGLLLGASNLHAQIAKNVILMISDGQGFNTVQATEYFAGGKAIYETGTGWTRLAMQTNSAGIPVGQEDAYVGKAYDPAKMASDFTYAKGIGTSYGSAGATDSASAATAMYTGVKVYDGEVNWSTTDQPLTTFFEDAASAGKNIGAVSSVQISHATPGAVYGHNSSRNNYAAIGYEGIQGSNPVNDLANNGGDGTNSHLAGDNNNYDSLNYNNKMVVLAGAGSGNHDDNGVSKNTTDRYVGGQDTWTAVQGVTPPNGWDLVQSTTEFSSIAAGTANPDKLLGIANVNGTLQQSRAPRDDYNADGNGPANNWGGLTGAARTAAINADITACPVNAGLNPDMPTLATITGAALNVLDNNPNGFAVMIEGGAVDWAGHANQMNRMIEEQIDFNNSVATVCAYLDANTNGNNWFNTLLIVTADHETGFLMGTADGSDGYFDVNGDKAFTDGVDYAHIGDNGDNALPDFKFHSTIHSNQLVPLYAKGAGSDLFNNYIVGTETNLDGFYNLDDSLGFTGEYIDNTAVYHVMSLTAIPEPGSMLALSGLVGAGVFLRSRRRR